jgi:LacI family transcriptional regulator
MNGAPTQRDVAKAAGVSQALVSVVLSGREDTSIQATPEVRQRVVEAASRLNYRPNAGARAMRTRRFQSIGYCAPGAQKWEFDFHGTRPGIYEAATAHGYRVIMVRLPADDRLPKVLEEASLDGMVLHNDVVPPKVKEELARQKLPVVYLNERRETNAVYLDDRDAATRMARHLVDIGCRRIAYFTTMPYVRQHHSWTDRVEGACEVVEAAGGQFSTKVVDGYCVQPSRREILDWLGSADRPDAVQCHTDHDALVFQSYLYDSPFVVPRDVALSGFEGDLLPYMPVPLTTMQVFRYEMAVAAVDMLVRLIAQPNRQPLPSVPFYPELVVKESTSGWRASPERIGDL